MFPDIFFTFKIKFIRVDHKTEATDMIQYLYGKKGWALTPPKLILSITGGAQNFTISPQMRNAFSKGLMKAAISTGAWIMTGGTNAGVMKLVGQAVDGESSSVDALPPVFGIASWGKISGREDLVVIIFFD